MLRLTLSAKKFHLFQQLKAHRQPASRCDRMKRKGYEEHLKRLRFEARFIPHEDVPREKVKLPRRPPKQGKHDSEVGLVGRTFVPEMHWSGE